MSPQPTLVSISLEDAKKSTDTYNKASAVMIQTLFRNQIAGLFTKKDTRLFSILIEKGHIYEHTGINESIFNIKEVPAAYKGIRFYLGVKSEVEIKRRYLITFTDDLEKDYDAPIFSIDDFEIDFSGILHLRNSLSILDLKILHHTTTCQDNCNSQKMLLLPANI